MDELLTKVDRVFASLEFEDAHMSKLTKEQLDKRLRIADGVGVVVFMLGVVYTVLLLYLGLEKHTEAGEVAIPMLVGWKAGLAVIVGIAVMYVGLALDRVYAFYRTKVSPCTFVSIP